MEDENLLRKLCKFNWAASILHLVVGVILAIVVGVYMPPMYPMTTSKFTFQGGQNATEVFVPPTESLMPASTQLSPVTLLLSFPFLTAAFHLVAVYFHDGFYSEHLRRGFSILRWAEYSITASVMSILIATMSGMSQVTMLVQIFGLTFAVMWLGFGSDIVAAETTPENRKYTVLASWMLHIAGYVVFAFLYVPIIYFFFTAVNSTDAPASVKTIPFLLLVLYTTFGINQTLQRFGVGKWKSAIFTEYVYIVLSFSTKTILAFFVLAGLVRKQ